MTVTRRIHDRCYIAVSIIGDMALPAQGVNGRDHYSDEFIELHLEEEQEKQGLQKDFEWPF